MEYGAGRNRVPFGVLRFLDSATAAHELGQDLATLLRGNYDDPQLPERLRAMRDQIPAWVFPTLAEALLETALLLDFPCLPYVRFGWEMTGFLQDADSSRQAPKVLAYVPLDSTDPAAEPHIIVFNEVFLLELTDMLQRKPETQPELEELLWRIVAEEAYHLYEALHFPATIRRTMTACASGLLDGTYERDRGERAAKLFALQYADCKEALRDRARGG